MKKRILSLFLVALLLSPLSTLPPKAQANGEYMDSKNATYFLAFIYNSKVDEMNMDTLDNDKYYKLLTGQLSNNAMYEYEVKSQFLLFMNTRIEQTLSKSGHAVKASNATLLEYLTEQYNGEISSSILDIFKENVLSSLIEFCGYDSNIIMPILDNMVSIFTNPTKYAKDLYAIADALYYSYAANVESLYLYFDAALSCAGYSDDAYKTAMEANKLILQDGNIFSNLSAVLIPGLTHWTQWQDQLDYWAKYAHNMEREVLSGPPSYTITFNSNCSYVDSVSKTFNIGEEAEIPDMSRPGYILEGWYTDSACTNEILSYYHEDQTWYAKWIPTTYTITFNSNCSYVDSISKTSNIGEKTEIPNMSRPGYILEGWYTDSACTNKILSYSFEDQTWYAKWVPEFDYTVSNNQITITGLAYYKIINNVKITDIVIPETIDGCSVTFIDAEAFMGNESITSVILPEGITSIGYRAFSSCSSLKNITIPNSVTALNPYVFAACKSLTTVNLPKNIVSIGEGTFRGCSALTSITIPDSVTYIGEQAFGYCSSLTDITISNNITSISKYLFANCSALISITIPDSVTCIEQCAFVNCTSLKTVSIPNSVTSIDVAAFRGCSALTNVTIPNSVTTINSNTFENCTSLKTVSIPNSVTSIGESAFSGCSALTNVTIPNSVTTINSNTFMNCTSLKTVSIPNSVTSIGESAFSGCSALTNATIPDGVTSINSYTFKKCTSLKNITIPDGVTSIGIGAFNNCLSMTNVTIPDSVTSIGASAFRSCSSLTNITIPDGVTSIGAAAFDYCSSLTNITIPDSVTSIGAVAFRSCSSLTNITIPDGVTSIGIGAFQYCSSLTNITIPDGVTSISSGAFNNCLSLTNVTIPDGVTSIGTSAFWRCSSLTTVSIPNSVTSIGERAFSGCSALTNVTIPNSVTTINAKTFENCTSLKTVSIPNNVTSIGESAFSGCSSLTDITIPDGVTDLGFGAFYVTHSLNSITLPESLTIIPDMAFGETDNVKTVFYKGTEAQWKNIYWSPSSCNEHVKSPEQLYFIDGTYQSDTTKIKYTKNSTTANIVPHEKHIGKTVVFAMYKNGVLADVKCDVFRGDALEFSSDVECDTINIMIWDDLTSLTPVCENEVISTSFWT